MTIQPQTFAAVYHATGGFGRFDHKALMRATIKRDLALSGLDFDGVFHGNTTHYDALLDHVAKVPNRTWPALVNRLTMDQMRDYLAGRADAHDAELALLPVGRVGAMLPPDAITVTSDLAQEVLGDDVEEAPKPASTPTFALPEVDPAKLAALDNVMSGFELPTYSDIKMGVTVLSEALTAAESRPVGGGLTITLGEVQART